MGKIYKTSTDFKKALTAKLKEISRKEGVDIQRLQRRVSFDRLLCRLFSDSAVPWILKGGHALELRLNEARSTKDIDLGMNDKIDFGDTDNQSELVLQKLQRLSSIDLHDYFEFKISPSNLDLEAPPYGGFRFNVDVQIAGKIYVKFHIDVGIGDVWMSPYEQIKLEDWLGFADIQPLSIPIISMEQHFAEKLHAYTLPRESENSRVKDLIDLCLLIQKKNMDIQRLKQAIHLTFNRRKTHGVPKDFSPPPVNWEKPFRAMAEESNLDLDMMTGYERLKEFYFTFELHSLTSFNEN